MPIETLTLDKAKQKFARPLLRIMRAGEEEREGLISQSAQRASWDQTMQRMHEAINKPNLTPRPFPGKWPTRVLMFRSPSYTSTTTYYFGKRTRDFNIGQIRFTWHNTPIWLEFDRENVVFWFDWGKAFSSPCLALNRIYYPTLSNAGVRGGTIYRVFSRKYEGSSIRHYWTRGDFGEHHILLPGYEQDLRSEEEPESSEGEQLVDLA